MPKDSERNEQTAISPINLSEVRALARILKGYELTAIEVECQGLRIKLERGLVAGFPPPTAMSGAGLPSPRDPSAASPAPTAEEPKGGQFITSPFVGTFYRAPSPEAAPFVEEGQVVKKGQVLCIVEAMKLMNEIESDAACRILEVLIRNGDPVEFGQALFRIAPLD